MSERVVLALLGDMMLGRGVAEVLADKGPDALFSDDLIAVLSEADAVLANLECCISTRGERWPNPDKPFFFRAPPIAVEALHRLGVTVVTLANNHALDYGYDALLDTLDVLHDAGIGTTGAGGAATSRPGVAYSVLGATIDDWVTSAIRGAADDCVIVTPHWGPNMVGEPIGRVRAAAAVLRRAGASVVVGHSAHVFHGIADRVIFDLGDFIDDYITHPELRNDLGLMVLLELYGGEPTRASAVPIALDHCHTRLANQDEASWIRARFVSVCAALGTTVHSDGDRVVVDLPAR